jgi:hypothetical protein
MALSRWSVLPAQRAIFKTDSIPERQWRVDELDIALRVMPCYRGWLCYFSRELSADDDHGLRRAQNLRVQSHRRCAYISRRKAGIYRKTRPPRNGILASISNSSFNVGDCIAFDAVNS